MSKAMFNMLAACSVLSAGVVMAEDASKELGNVMFVGDSITHGYGAPSYRWPLHKIFVDNGVQFVAVGVTQGNQNPRFCIVPGTEYAGVPFNNRHSAMSSERAYEIAGRINKSGRLGNSNIHDWLGLDTSYAGDFKLDTGSQMPDVMVMMIGTNDTLSDFGNKGGIGSGKHMAEVQKNLIGTRKGKKWSGDGDMDVIVDSMRKANPKVRIFILSIPTWHDNRNNNNKAEDFAVVMDYNEALEQWAAFKKIEFVDVNKGLIDPARTDKPGVGEPQFFNANDKLHPTVQGDLLIAAEVADALGYPGRTVGLERKPSAEFTPLELKGKTLKSTRAMQLPVSGAKAFTGVVKCSVGDGKKGGWKTEDGLRITLGNGQQTGVLTVTESAIIWGEKKDRVLYCSDMSANEDEIRIALVPGNTEEGREPGFYVWLGDRLIGEALPGMDPACNGHVPGLVLSPIGKVAVKVSSAGVADGAYAPASAQ